VQADLLLVTHEHADHNAVQVVGGSPQIIRSTAGTFESPVGELIAVASEHDDVAGTERGPNTIFRFTLDGLRVSHFGDFGDPPDEYLAALGARVERLDESELEAERILGTAEDPTVALLAPPL
jgi:L-ascorbate metabolism protein UlaG (beta-lactamase superfamily)